MEHAQRAHELNMKSGNLRHGKLRGSRSTKITGMASRNVHNAGAPYTRLTKEDRHRQRRERTAERHDENGGSFVVQKVSQLTGSISKALGNWWSKRSKTKTVQPIQADSFAEARSQKPHFVGESPKTQHEQQENRVSWKGDQPPPKFDLNDLGSDNLPPPIIWRSGDPDSIIAAYREALDRKKLGLPIYGCTDDEYHDKIKEPTDLALKRKLSTTSLDKEDLRNKREKIDTAQSDEDDVVELDQTSFNDQLKNTRLSRLATASPYPRSPSSSRNLQTRLRSPKKAAALPKIEWKAKPVLDLKDISTERIHSDGFFSAAFEDELSDSEEDQPVESREEKEAKYSYQPVSRTPILSRRPVEEDEDVVKRRNEIEAEKERKQNEERDSERQRRLAEEERKKREEKRKQDLDQTNKIPLPAEILPLANKRTPITSTDSIFGNTVSAKENQNESASKPLFSFAGSSSKTDSTAKAAAPSLFGSNTSSKPLTSTLGGGDQSKTAVANGSATAVAAPSLFSGLTASSPLTDEKKSTAPLFKAAQPAKRSLPTAETSEEPPSLFGNLKAPGPSLTNESKNILGEVKKTDASAATAATQKPLFSFAGASQTPFGTTQADGQVKDSTSAKDSKVDDAAKPTLPTSSAFSFGGKPTEATAIKTPSTFSFGSNPTEAAAPPASSTFSFGSKPTEAATVTAPSTFSFGSKPTETTTLASKTTEAAPSLLGSAAGSKPVGSSGSSPFSFSGSTINTEIKPTETSSESKPSTAFKFGAPAASTENKAPPSLFSFGSSEKKDEPSSKPFTFSTTSSNTAPTQNPESLATAAKPSGFSFGAPKPVVTEAAKEAKPLFGGLSSANNAAPFGSSSTASLFGQPSSSAATTAFGAASKSASSFGGLGNATTISTPAPTGLAASSFGSNNTNTSQNTPKSSFTFGSTPANPTSGFGQTSNPANAFGSTTSNVGGFGAPANASAAFGASSNNSTPFGQQQAQPLQFNDKPSFNFGAGAGTGTGAGGFQFSNQANSSQSAPMFASNNSFGGSAPAFGATGNVQTNPQTPNAAGRKIAAMRRRRPAGR